MPFTTHDLRAILAEEVGLEVGVVELDATLAELGLDSLAVVEIQLAVRRRFGVAMPDDDAYSPATVRELLAYVNDRPGWAEAA